MSSIAESLAAALALHQAGRLEQAEQIYRRVLQADPRNADAWHLLGVIGSQVNRHEVAVEYIRRAIDLSPNSTSFHANLGAAYHKLKRLDEAVSCYRRALELNPNNAEAHNNLGVALQARGDAATAADCFRRAVSLNPNYAEAHSNLGNVLQALGKAAEALASHQRAAELKPGYAEAHHGIGAALKELGRLDEAIAAYRRALELRESAPETHNNLGVALKDRGQLDEAVRAYRRALELKPDYAEAHTNLGNTLREQGKLDEAIACHRRALEFNPEFAEALINIGNAYKDQGSLDQAMACYGRAIELKPGLPDVHNSLGVGMQVQGRFPEAMACFQRALQLDPDSPETHNNLGNVLKEAAQYDAAIGYYERALQLNPDFAEAHNNLGNAYKDQGKIDEAIACYERALEIKPDFAEVRSNLIFSLHYRPGATLDDLARAHAEFDRRHAVFAATDETASRLVQERLGDAPLRLGFVSPDFCEHPVGFFLIRALENLDRREAEIVCYNDRGPSDRMTARFQTASLLWREVPGWSHERLAEQIRTDSIDILFDLAGHTARNRMLTLVRKPAPVQISWIGYEGTTGLSTIDYLLTDRFMTPEGFERHFLEKVLRLPDCYLCYEPPADAPPVSPLPAARSGHVTFASCNNPAKLNQEVVATWAEILDRVPNSKLLMKYRGLEDTGIRARYFDLFAARGIAADRLELEGWSPLSELLNEHSRIDMALDPFPFAGGVTTCNALWMGVPVVTLPGETCASRHALSYLSAIDFTETIAGSRAEYIEIAVRLAADLPRLAEIRAGLRRRMAASPLCDGRRFAGQLMEVLRSVAVPPRQATNLE